MMLTACFNNKENIGDWGHTTGCNTKQWLVKPHPVHRRPLTLVPYG